MSKNIKQIKCNNRTEFIKAQLNFIDDYVGFETGFITIKSMVDMYWNNIIKDENEDYALNIKCASSYIESLLISADPSVIVLVNINKDKKECNCGCTDSTIKYNVIDGNNRIKALALFKANKFKLTGLAFLTTMEGMSYDDFDDEIKKVFNDALVRLHVFNIANLSYAVSFVSDLFKHVNRTTCEDAEVSKFTKYMLSKFILIPDNKHKEKSNCESKSECKDTMDPYVVLMNKCVKRVREIDINAFKEVDVDKADRLIDALKLIPEDELDNFFEYFKRVTG